MTPPDVRSVNEAIVCLGLSEMGKSTYAVERALRFQRRYGAYVLAHDPGSGVPDQLPDRRRIVVHRHESIEDCRKALLVSPGGVHAIGTMDASEVIAFAKQVALDSRRQWTKPGEPERGFPVVLIIDEAVACASANPRRVGQDLLDLWVRRRHHHVVPIITGQSSKMVNYELMSQAREIVLFRLHGERAFAVLREVNVSEELLEKCKNLKPHRFLVHNPFKDAGSTP